MKNLQDVHEQVKQKLISSIVEGIGRFPVPSTYPILHETPSENSCSLISNCSSCPLSVDRKRVVVSTSFELKKYFVLSDFPDKEDEASEEVFSPVSPISSIAINLLEKLGIHPSCHFSFALKCHPEKGFLDPSLQMCVHQNLSLEISMVKPKIILCFGYRAFRSLMVLDNSLKNSPMIENSEFSFSMNEETTIRLFFLPSLRDLKDFPHWRKQVWKVLSPLPSE